MNKITFNRPHLTGNEIEYIRQAVESGKISGDGKFTKQCHQFFESKYTFQKCLLTTSCTDALEMCAVLLDVKQGDEVIMPSYTFVSTANPFVMRGAKVVFCDSRNDHPNIDEDKIEPLITDKTKAIVVVHYAGVACHMEKILDIAARHRLKVVEDAAQAIDSFYKGMPLGSFGSLATFSFHETKNVNCGEGGMLVINDPKLNARAEIIREKGTNRSAFFRGEVDKYNWMDIGSSYLPSDLNAAYLFAQLECLSEIQDRRKVLWNRYYQRLKPMEERGWFEQPKVPSYATNNAHIFYVVCRSVRERNGLIDHLRTSDIQAIFHYLSLHKSPFYQNLHDGRSMEFADHFSECLVRLPLFQALTMDEIDFICEKVERYFLGLQTSVR